MSYLEPKELTHAKQLITENQYKEALQVLIELEKKENIPLTHKVSYLTLQARILIWLGRFEDATKKCEQAYEEKLGLVKSIQILQPLILKALIYNWHGKFDKSFEIIKKSEDLFRTFDKESSIPSEYIATEASLNFIKGFLVSQKDPNKGLELLEYSSSLWDKLDLRIEKAMTIMCIGLILYSSKGKLDQSIKHLKKALAIAEKINHKWGVANLKSNLGNSYYLKGEINQSLKYYQNALQLYKEINNKIQMAYLYSNIGGIMAEKGEFEQALKNIESSLAIFKEIGAIYGMFSPLGNIIEITLEMGDMEKN
jgi:tetratricopeptide (TPR) repeat protein